MTFDITKVQEAFMDSNTTLTLFKKDNDIHEDKFKKDRLFELAKTKSNESIRSIIQIINGILNKEHECYICNESTEITEIIIEKADDMGEEIEVKVPLLNAILVPLQQVVIHSLGNIKKRFITLTAIQNKRILETVTVPVDDLLSEKWLFKSWGFGLRIYTTSIASAYRHIKQYLQIISSRIPITHVYNYLGWLEDVPYVYLHGGGTIGKYEGDRIEPDKSLADLTLKTADISEEKAILFILNTAFKIADKNVSWTAMSYGFLGIIISLLRKRDDRPEHTLYIVGESGSKKTSIAKKYFNYTSAYLDNIHIHFDMSTQAAIEVMATIIRDSVCIYDDIPPVKDESSRRNQEKKVEQIVRTNAKNKGRQKLSHTMEKIESKPEGLTVITAESLVAKGTSTIDRMLILSIDKNSVDIKKLTKAQRKKYHIPTAVKYYIQYIAENGDSYMEKFMDMYRSLVEKFHHVAPNIHGRLIKTAAWQLTSFSTYLWYAYSVLTPESSKRINFKPQKMIDEYFDILLNMIIDQDKLAREENEVNMFVKAVKELIVTNRIKLLPVTVKGKKKEVTADYKGKDVVGFIDSEYLYMFKDTIMAVIRSYYKKLGRVFPVDLNTLLEALEKKDLLKCDKNKDKTKTVKLTINGNRLRVIRLDRDVFESLDDDGTSNRFFEKKLWRRIYHEELFFFGNI
jgi:hypothetical protein